MKKYYPVYKTELGYAVFEGDFIVKEFQTKGEAIDYAESLSEEF